MYIANLLHWIWDVILTCAWWWCQWIKRMIFILLCLLLFVLSYAVPPSSLCWCFSPILIFSQKCLILYSPQHIKGSVPKIESNVCLQGIFFSFFSNYKWVFTHSPSWPLIFPQSQSQFFKHHWISKWKWRTRRCPFGHEYLDKKSPAMCTKLCGTLQFMQHKQ